MCPHLYTVHAIHVSQSINHGNFFLAKNVTPQEMKNIRLKARGMYLCYHQMTAVQTGSEQHVVHEHHCAGDLTQN
jgi:hypothetical protein